MEPVQPAKALEALGEKGFGVAEFADAAFYRRRAAEMRRQAERAQTDQIRASYLAIAESWERLAEQTERDHGTAASPPASPKP